MARPSEVTYELVASTAAKIQAQQGKVTTRSVREMLGTGSLATISPLLHRWAEDRQLQNPAGDGLDASIMRAINAQIAAKVQEATTTATQRIADIQAEAASLIDEIERLETALENKDDELATLSEQHSALAGRLQQLEMESTRNIAALAAERQSTQSAHIALAKAELRLEAVPRIESEIESIRADLSKSIKLQAELHEAAAVAQALLAAEIKQREHCEKQLAEAIIKREEAVRYALSATEALSNERISAQACQDHLEIATIKKSATKSLPSKRQLE